MYVRKKLRVWEVCMKLLLLVIFNGIMVELKWVRYEWFKVIFSGLLEVLVG